MTHFFVLITLFQEGEVVQEEELVEGQFWFWFWFCMCPGSVQLMKTSSLRCVVDPSLELDVVEANRQFMEVSEELYDALIDSRWQLAELNAEQEHMTSSLPEPIYC